jgi:hypothetical protein
MTPSASATALLLQCSRPFGEGVPIEDRESPEAAKFGLAWHAVAAWAIPFGKMPLLSKMARPIGEAATAYGVPHLAPEIEGHLASSLPTLFNWLNGIPLAKGEKMEVLIEQSFALHVASGGVRKIENPTVEDHIYETKPGEMPGTLDLAVIIRNPKGVTRIYMTDHKTGAGDFSRPDRLPQILTLVLMLLGYLKSKGMKTRPRIIAGVFHAFRRGIAKMYEDDVEDEALERHHALLKQGFSRIGDGTMRPGPMCERCPARPGCPAGDSELLLKAEALIKRINPLLSGAIAETIAADGGVASGSLTKAPGVPAGALGKLAKLTPPSKAISPQRKLGMLYEASKLSDQLAARSRENIKTEMEAGVLPELSSGEVLVLAERLVERMSKRDFIEIYGRLGAERMFNKWRRDGALVKKSETFIKKAGD